MTELAKSKEKIITATIELICLKGFDGTSLNEILKASGVTKSNFYYHFKSKENLGLTVLDTLIQGFVDNLLKNSLMNETLTPTDRLKVFFEFLSADLEKYCCNKGCPFTNIACETSDMYPVFQQKLSDYFEKFLSVICKCCKEGINLGEFRTDLDPQMLAKFILAEIKGTIILSRMSKDLSLVKQNYSTLINLISKQ